MNKEQAINEIKYAKSFGTSGIVPRWEAIDTILDYIADLEKENAVKESNFKIVSKYNEELENKLKIQTQNYHSAHEDINWFCDKYIPKQKVRDKIEELEEEDLEIYDTDSEDLIIAKYEQRAVLDFAQQLLNDKEEK